ncbi:uncharacterized protein BDZ83DRAFT_728649 [Colletotrichum acutatum]|uniref:Uncharacterized protein n=1 Tax=Glomerella acutata TaxID=27357 RepID=A0AAD8XHT3_GLOAC|nr:uncharacterized protein BDZ83DRAFT_728649 [Colletotrichum acutatum]KAK1727767.1 hypothetical protein BDZ83DRAFT_728649 [Colletotrichum acutatum]
MQDMFRYAVTHTRDADVIDEKSQLSRVSDLRQSLQDKHEDGRDCTTPRHSNASTGSAAVTAPIRTKEPPFDLRYASSRAAFPWSDVSLAPGAVANFHGGPRSSFTEPNSRRAALSTNMRFHNRPIFSTCINDHGATHNYTVPFRSSIACVGQSIQYGVRADILAVAGAGSGDYLLIRGVATEEPAA